MAKILLVEDDNNLREIYEARLQAEGYTIVSAQDGEEALVKAKQEKPDLVISDVMMPRISGFEMLDILRNTEGLKDTKVIMLTALGQAEDKTRADALGADRYLVKSQVTLEDIVKAADELLGTPAEASSQTTEPTVSTGAAVTPTPPTAVTPTVAPVAVQTPPTAAPAPTAPTINPSPTEPAGATTPATPEETPAQEPATVKPPAKNEVSDGTEAPAPTAPETTQTPEPTGEAPAAEPQQTADAVQKDDDKLMADAMKQLNDTLETTAPTSAQTDTPAAIAPTVTSEPTEVKNEVSDGTEAPAPTAPETTQTPEPSTSTTAPIVEPEAAPTVSAVADETPPVEAVVETTPTPDLTIPSTAAPAAAAAEAQNASSAADEQALMQKQIDSFIQQQNTQQAPIQEAAPTAPETIVTPETAAEPLSTGTPEDNVVVPAPPLEEPATAEPPVTTSPTDTDNQTTTTVQPTETTPGSAPSEDPDSVAVAGKKIIQPPVEPVAAQPDLNELLAKEGISSLEDHNPGPQAGPYTTPHQPGHVISPNGTPAVGMSPDDPNNIAL